MSVEIENVRKDVRMRAESDPVMSNAWLLVYLIPVLAIIVGVLSFLSMIILGVVTYVPRGPPGVPPGPAVVPMLMGMALMPLLGIIGFIVSLILIYKLVKRRNTHFKRQHFLFEDVIGAVRTIAEKKGVDVEVWLSSCDRTVREARAEETEKGAVLWAILSAIIILAHWYVNYFLMKDFYKHERREEGFWEDVRTVLNKMDVPFSLPRRTEVMPDRSFVLYLILTIITLGLFGIYWLYVLLKDPNEHFKYHIQVEDELLSALESVAI
ncbi:MAG: DUF4234 domain-containing protein [Candidatus Bathyarchaeia archaeon]